jgi:hypothetical protein
MSNEIPRDLAVKVFHSGVQQCKSTEELSVFAQMLCVLSAKLIHGIEGQDVKADFLMAAIADKEMITPIRPN